MPVLRELDRAECERLLRRGTFGRVVVCAAGRPEIVPVNYAVDGDAVVIRTTSHGLLARSGHGRPLAFEIDLVDHERWHGWSVVARGTGEVVDEPGEGVPGRLPPRPWAEGDRRTELRLRWTELSGRKVGSGWDTEAAMYARQVTP